MLLGLGLGPAGRGPPGLAKSPGAPVPVRGPPGRGADGRGPPGVAVPGPPVPGCELGCGALVAPMPVAVELNGLLPGRGPGRGACRWPGAAGAAGRGPAAAAGRAAGESVSAGGRCGPAAGSDWNGIVTAGAWPAGAAAGGSTGDGATGGSAGRWTSAGPGPASDSAVAPAPTLPLALRLAAGAFAPPSAACGLAACWDANASLSLRTTGASIVEDAERTNSPISVSLAITALLSTPNSLASSYTRTFATTLPQLGPDTRTLAPTGAACAPSGVSLCCSSPHAHRLIAISASFFRRFQTPVPQAARTRPSGYKPHCPSGIPRPCRPAARPEGAVLAGKPVGAGHDPSMPAGGAGMHPGREAAGRRRGQSRPPPPPRGPARTLRRGLRTQRMSSSVPPTCASAQSART